MVTPTTFGVPRIVPGVGLPRRTISVSERSVTESSRTGTVKEAVLCPAAKDRVPEVAVKSLPFRAVSPLVM